MLKTVAVGDILRYAAFHFTTRKLCFVIFVQGSMLYFGIIVCFVLLKDQSKQKEIQFWYNAFTH